MFAAKQQKVTTLLFIAGALTFACGKQSREVSEAEFARAQAALTPFKQQLLEALRSALHEGGPALAIPVCQMEAPEIAAVTSTENARMGRTSHRPRNPQNLPEPWMQSFLDHYVANPVDRQPRARRLDADHIGYVEPIYVKPLCLACHGEQIEPEVRALLQEHYPEDEAIGFREDDFRGLFWVKLRTEAAD
jgi:hypothetical protein